MKTLYCFLLGIMALPIWAQQPLSLQDCYRQVTENYPLAKQKQMLETQNTLDLEAVSKKRLPQIDLAAQATYQSDVTAVPVPNINVAPLDKDQYRASASVNQLIFNAGMVQASIDAKNAAFKTKEKQVEVEVYQLKQQVNQLYFSILMQQKKQQLLQAQKTALETKLKEVRAGVKYGALLPSSDKAVETGLLRVGQQMVAAENDRVALLQTLSSLIGRSISKATILEEPILNTQFDTNLKRPELALYNLKKEEIETNTMLVAKQVAPKLYGFFSGGYGKPGLNMLDNSFQTFYTVGLKLNWNVFDWKANKKQREALAINKDIVDNQAEVFRLKTTITLNQLMKEIEKNQAFIESDARIINLQKSVTETANSQLNNGVITASAYLTEVTKLYEYKTTLALHTIQLELAKANYNIIKGQ